MVQYVPALLTRSPWQVQTSAFLHAYTSYNGSAICSITLHAKSSCKFSARMHTTYHSSAEGICSHCKILRIYVWLPATMASQGSLKCRHCSFWDETPMEFAFDTHSHVTYTQTVHEPPFSSNHDSSICQLAANFCKMILRCTWHCIMA